MNEQRDFSERAVLTYAILIVHDISTIAKMDAEDMSRRVN